jgi:hypothetical protein
MRAAEWINTVYFVLLLGLAWTRSLPPEKRVRATALGILGLSLVSLSLVISSQSRSPAASVIRDWLPAPIILVAYWQAGQFFIHASERVQRRLVQFDENLLQLFRRRMGTGFRWLSSYFEFAYLFCYPMIPLGISALYLTHSREHIDQLWIVVLPATYGCYLALPFIQVLPPWMLSGQTLERRGAFRRLNLLINHHLSIRVDTCPSAHVAASLGTALALLRISTSIGLLLLWLAMSIAIGSVVRRYHYTLDVLFGAALAFLAFVFSLVLQA